MKILTAIIFMLSVSGLAWGQSVESLQRRLAQTDPSTGARVSITETGSTSQVVRSFSQSRLGRNINGYRVRIFFDNSQNARQYASATYNRFKELYPDTNAYMTYENPYFKVTVGNCLTIEEAIILWGRIKGVFEKAFVVREEIPLSTFAD